MKYGDVRRFWSKVDTRGPDECWLWMGTLHPTLGYGRFTSAGVTDGAHRWAYRLSEGAIPSGVYVCHRCDNRGCCNPRHLFLGSCSDNLRDMHAKGRATAKRATGTAHHSAKLTPDLVQRLRGEYAEGGVRQKDLAARYGINQATVSQIIRHEIWR
jgi:hypothetical protein